MINPRVGPGWVVDVVEVAGEGEGLSAVVVVVPSPTPVFVEVGRAGGSAVPAQEIRAIARTAGHLTRRPSDIGPLYPEDVFGPLNGVRLALVIAAALAGIVALFAGFTVAGIVLLVGVAIHGLGWLYLYNHR